jgi:hypothetical protein
MNSSLASLTTLGFTNAIEPSFVASVISCEALFMPWLTPGVFKQGRDEALTRLPRFGDGPKRIRFRHIIHAYVDAAVPENTAILPITFDTVARARQFAAPDYPVTCVAVTFPEDIELIPAGVIRAPTLQRDVMHVAEFSIPRRLPLLFDILKSGVSVALSDTEGPAAPRRIDQLFDRLLGKASANEVAIGPPDEVEFLILTNSDIHLQPAFYSVLAVLIEQGYDVITVNRRTIDVDPEGRSWSPLYLAERGSEHPGLDCFVFPTWMMKSFVPSECCCGAGHVMRSLLFNLVAHSRRVLMLTQAQMTFHLGDDRHWAGPKFAEYLEFNIAQAKSVIAALAKDPEKAKRLSEFIAIHEAEVFREAMPMTPTF